MSLNRVIAAGATISPPSWLPDNLCYQTIMGSVAYGVSADTSDQDVYAICLPPKDTLFPHLAGEIRGFGTQVKPFGTWQAHHVEALGSSWDFLVFGIVKFFELARQNNPNVIDALFTSRRCVLATTAVGEYIREHRHDFLHKGSWPKFKGYAYSQLHKIRNRRPTGARADLIAEHGYDVKFAYHVVRLLLEVEQILVNGDLDLELHREQLKEIRRGGWSLHRLEQWAEAKERALETAFANSSLPAAADEALLKRHLVHCLELHYGDLSSAIHVPDEAVDLLRTIASLTAPYRS